MDGGGEEVRVKGLYGAGGWWGLTRDGLAAERASSSRTCTGITVAARLSGSLRPSTGLVCQHCEDHRHRTAVWTLAAKHRSRLPKLHEVHCHHTAVLEASHDNATQKPVCFSNLGVSRSNQTPAPTKTAPHPRHHHPDSSTASTRPSDSFLSSSPSPR